MYPAGSTQSALQPDERRRSPRLTTSSIVLVHLGPDNGGIVINLSVDGVSCQAAMRLGLQAGTQLHVRLRGSGLNIETLAELVWIGAKQKEVGIRFKNLPEKQQKEISLWIERQRKPYAPPPAEDPFGLKPMRAMPSVSPPWDRPTPHSFPAAPLDALGMPEEKAPDPLASLSADEDEARLSALLDAEAGTSASPHLEIVPPVQEIPDSGNTVEASLVAEELSPAVRHSGVLPAPPTPVTESDARGTPLLQLPPAEIQRELPGLPVRAIEPTAAPVKAREDKAAIAVKSAAAVASSKTADAKAIPEPATNQTTGLRLANALEEWMPPALLTTWRHGTPRHRLLLAAGATLGLGFFALILVLAASHTLGPGVSPAAETNRPAAAPLAVAPVGAASGNAANASALGMPQPQIPQLSVQQRNAPRRSLVTPPLDPEASPLEKFVRFFVGPDTDDSDDAPRRLPQIREEQLGVQVWISKTSGYFYCTDDPYYKTVNPGALMPQGDALQDGYRPILNQFCD